MKQACEGNTQKLNTAEACGGVDDLPELDFHYASSCEVPRNGQTFLCKLAAPQNVPSTGRSDTSGILRLHHPLFRRRTAASEKRRDRQQGQQCQGADKSGGHRLLSFDRQIVVDEQPLNYGCTFTKAIPVPMKTANPQPAALQPLSNFSPRSHNGGIHHETSSGRTYHVTP